MSSQKDNLDRLLESFSTYSAYPKDIFGIDILEHSQKVLREQLAQRSKYLFSPECKSALHLLELQRLGEGSHFAALAKTVMALSSVDVSLEYQKCRIETASTLKAHLMEPIAQLRPDPAQRFFFINAGNSRAPLRVTRDMLLQILSYHQVTPAFINFIFPFGKQHYVRDFHLTGFRSDSRLHEPKVTQMISQLGRSGRHIEMCYSIKSVERSFDLERPDLNAWSIRQCSVHHRYDLDKNRMTWIIVKANQLIQNSVQNYCIKADQSLQNVNAPTSSIFADALAVHGILASWAGENWYLYISELEKAVQEKTRRSLFIPLEDTVAGFRVDQKDANDHAPNPRKKRPRSWSLRTLTEPLRHITPSSTWQTDVATLHEDPGLELETTESTVPSSETTITIDNFSFRDIQTVHFYEEKANEAMLVLRSNASVIRDLDREYASLLAHAARHTPLPDNFQKDIMQFIHHLQSIEKDLVMQQSRLEMLLRTLADRKSLLQGILTYRSMEASKHLAERAQASAGNVENMTKEMHLIAQKTKVETVSMRIITLVTLFFLPGTFISTLMSTPIVNFDDDQSSTAFSWRNVGVGALELYLVVSLPLVLLTFFAWYGVYKWEKRRETKGRSNKGDEENVGF